MFRFIYVVFLICFSMVAIGQNVEIKKSTEVVVIRGQSYYLHTVLKGQTLYSICKAYGLSVEEVKAMNDKKDNSLSLYDVLKLPYQEVFIQQDEEYYYHKTVKGETLYSIARHYDIKPRKLLKHNEEYKDIPLSIGAVVRLPLNDIDLSVLTAQRTQITNIVVPVARAAVVAETEEKEKENPKSRRERKKQEEIDRMIDSQVGIAVNLDTLVKDTLSVQGVGATLSKREREMPVYISEVTMPSNPFVKIALLLPFSAREYPMLVDSLQSGMLHIDSLLANSLLPDSLQLNTSQLETLQLVTLKADAVKISPRSERFIPFYQGILFAVDSLKKRGYKIELHLFDTELHSGKMYLLADKINRLNPDLIMGPIYGTTYKVFIDTLQNKNIPIIYPLSSSSDNLGEYPNFVQVNSSFGVVADHMLDWIKGQRDSANVVNLNILDIDYVDKFEKKAFRDSLKQMEGVLSFDWNLENTPLDSIRTLFLPDKENIIVLPLGKESDVSKYLPLISALTDVYPITVLGLPEWQSFTSFDHETYYKLNTKIFTHSYVDYSKDETKVIVNKFRDYYHIEPSILTFKAFDMGLYFIELAAKYRHQTLDALEYYDRSTNFSSFQFRKMKDGQGKENNGFYMVNFTPDFRMTIEGDKE